PSDDGCVAVDAGPWGPPASPPPRETCRPARPARAHGPTRASAGAWSTSRRASAPPDAPASGPPHSPLAFAALPLFSSSLAAPWPRSWGPFVLVDAILTPTREPSLLSSQVQQRPGHPRWTFENASVFSVCSIDYGISRASSFRHTIPRMPPRSL